MFRPEVEVVKFAVEDIITASTPPDEEETTPPNMGKNALPWN